jgi:PAS domain S-box-containing protein
MSDGILDLNLSEFINSLPDALFVVDEEGKILLVNAQVEAFFGYRQDELLGRSIDLLVPRRVQSVHPGHRAAYFNDPRTRRMGAGLDLAGRRKDGTEFPVDISLSSINTKSGTIVSAAVRDITVRKKIEAKFQGLLESAPDAVVGVDAAGIIKLVNRQAEVLFGYGRDELVGEPIEILVPDRVKAAHPSHRAKYFRDPLTRPMGAGLELAARRKDGTEFPADISLSSIETEEGILVSAAVRDTTEWVRTQQERESMRRRYQSERLESLGELAGGIAHDFNNLLAVILNYAGFVIEEMHEGDPVRNDVEEIRRAAERAASLTHQLLIFGRRELTKPEVLDVNLVVAETERLLSRTIGEHVDLRTRLASNLWPITADRSQLDQVLMNLAVNGRDAMPDGGILVIETANLEVDPELGERLEVASGPYVVFTVSDTGTGMSPTVAAHAFEPFFTTKETTKGSGLGLATVYGVVRQAGGHVELYTEVGSGTSFRVYLPADPEAVRPAVTVPAKPGGAGGETILVVEDEDAVREVAARILTRGGYTVLQACRPEEALTISREHSERIDLMLTDMVMPQMSGQELAARLGEERPETPVVFMSGYPGDVVRDRGELTPGITLVAKPFTSDQLLHAVRDALDEQAEPGPA